MSRVGIGYDVHKLVTDRKLILGGVDIPHEKGLLGHSDADVLLHAISDALLGAAALGDIGKHFPDTDERFKGISSLILLKHVGELLQAKNYKINKFFQLVSIVPAFNTFKSIGSYNKFYFTLNCKTFI